MGRRGRKPITETAAEPGRPKPPKDLDTVGKAAWNSLCDDLEEKGVLLNTDRKLIELYAKTYVVFDRVTNQLASEPLTCGSDERKFINPLATLYNTLAAKLHRILLDCGLSPSTRKNGAKPGGGDWEDILGGPSI